MTKGRTITKLELRSTSVGIPRSPGWVYARWTRADDSRGEVSVQFRRKTAKQWYIAQLMVQLPSTPLLRDVPLARITSAANADPEIRAWLESGADNPIVVELARRSRRKFKRPERHHLDDAFYHRVGEAYTAAVAAGLQPAKTLADDSETPQGTVNRWIGEARRRGYLPPTEPGKVSA